MRNSKILAKIRAGQPARLTMMGHYLPPFIAYSAQFGYDGIWLDLEHRAMDAREVQALLAFFHLYDIDCLVRPPTREKTQLYRYFEDGAAGLVIPQVSTPEEARDLVQKVKFPPVGDRGIEGGGLEGNYGLDTAIYGAKLADHALQETFLILQIETPDGLANLDEILAVPGVDGVYVGPGDMGLRMRLKPEEQRVAGRALMEQVAAACKKHNKVWGYFAGPADDLRTQRELGAQLMLWGVDFRLLRENVQAAGALLDDLLGEGEA